MGRKPCCEKVGLRRGSWTPEEDKKLINFMLAHQHSHCCWRTVPKLAGLLRCGKSCRLRWTNYLRPDLRRGLLSESEEQLVIDLHAKLGNRWSKIASHLPGRTDNGIKNMWNTHIKKKLRKMGVDPLTHELVPAAHSSADQPQDDEDDTAAAAAPASSSSEREVEKNPPPAPPLGGDYCPEFRVEEVPIIEPHEMLIPVWEPSSSSLYSFPSSACSSPAKAGRRETHDMLPCMEMQQESVCFWGQLDDLNGWFAINEGDDSIHMY